MPTLVVFLIAAFQVQAVIGAVPVMGYVFDVFVAYLIAAALRGVGFGRVTRLPVFSSRALIFGFGTRNSLVVLPLALALESHWQTATVVIIFQSLGELLGWSSICGPCRG